MPLVPELVDKLNAGIDVLDIGCGAGRAMNYLAGLFPNSRFTGYDFSEEAIARGERTWRRAIDEREVRSPRRGSINETSKFDVITAFDAIHDQRDPARVPSQIEKALRDDGTFLMQDIRASSHVENNMELPLATLLYTISTMHCMTVTRPRRCGSRHGVGRRARTTDARGGWLPQCGDTAIAARHSQHVLHRAKVGLAANDLGGRDHDVHRHIVRGGRHFVDDLAIERQADERRVARNRGMKRS